MGKKKGDDEDPGKRMRRKPGESGEELARRLAKNAARGKQLCGTCNGRKTVQVKREKAMPNGRVQVVSNTETCATCKGFGMVAGRTR